MVVYRTRIILLALAAAAAQIFLAQNCKKF